MRRYIQDFVLELTIDTKKASRHYCSGGYRPMYLQESVVVGREELINGSFFHFSETSELVD